MLRAANIRKIRSGVWYPVAVSLLKRASFYDFEIYDSLWIYVWRVHGLNSDGVDYIIMTMWLLESVVRLKKKNTKWEEFGSHISRTIGSGRIPCLAMPCDIYISQRLFPHSIRNDTSL